ncbi:MAG: hypothetical protein ABF381_14770, partial [Akkermansiaceae bacterium]
CVMRNYAQRGSIKKKRNPCIHWTMKYSVISGSATVYLMFQLLAESITDERLETWSYFYPI